MESGDYKMAAFSDDHMSRLYEKFILEYYRQNHPYLTEVKAAQLDAIAREYFEIR